MDAGARKGELRSLEWLLVALRRRYLGGASLRVELVADDVPYRIILNKSRAEIMRGATPSPDLTLRGSARRSLSSFSTAHRLGERRLELTSRGVTAASARWCERVLEDRDLGEQK